MAAAGQFAAHGYDGTTFSSIAAAMGKPKSAVGYHQFSSKQALAASVVARQWNRWRGLLGEAESIPPGLVRMLTIMLSAVLDEEANVFAGATVRLLTEPDAGIPLPDSAFSWRAYGVEQLEVDIAAGSLPAATDPRAVIQSLLVAMFGVRSTKQHGLEEINSEDQLRKVWRDILTGLGIDAEGCLARIPWGGLAVPAAVDPA